MKRLITLAIMAVCMVISCNKFDDSAIWDKLNDHENRIVYLEEVCKKMNNDIVNLQTIVTALETNDYIVNASSLATGDGYTFIFKSGKSVVIYNGMDGKDGTNGKDGQNGSNGIDGVTPVISAKQDIDGIYYWTVNNEWLLVNGEKVKAAASDGKNGVDGKDGITPKFKIEEDYWFISYDNGSVWERLGKATGSNGMNGIDGENGDSIFQNVTQDGEFVHFHLTDGTMITLSKYNPINIQFEDLNVKAICCKNWDTNKDGELSYSEASVVTELYGFRSNENIVAFTELKYFTNLKVIPTFAFWGCTSLWKISFPANLESIGHGALKDCKNVEVIRMPETIKFIESEAFRGCESLIEINIPDAIVSIPDYFLEGCKKLKDIVLPNNVEVIGSNAFASCKSIESLVFPETVTQIGDEACCYCENLKKLFLKPTTPPSLPQSSNFISSCHEDKKIYVPNESLNKYKYTSPWSSEYKSYLVGYDY